ncbi:MAG: hypothetical protein ACK5S6_00470 [bacterium]|jgi:hypothetical protein
MKLNKQLLETKAKQSNLVVTAELEAYTTNLLAQVQRIIALNVVRQNCRRIVLDEIQQHFFDKP